MAQDGTWPLVLEAPDKYFLKNTLCGMWYVVHCVCRGAAAAAALAEQDYAVHKLGLAAPYC